ncbi:Mu transposase domain-containing protein [Lentilactobacillus rapi]
MLTIVHSTCDQLNHESSQATQTPPYLLLDKEKEYFHEFDYDLLDSYASQTIARKVSKESMVVFQNRKYSVPTRYIGNTVQIKHNDNTLWIYYNGELIRSHAISSKRFNYTRPDMEEIVRSDLYKNRDDDVIDEYVERNLKMFDEME